MGIDSQQLQAQQQSSMVEWAVGRRSVKTVEYQSHQLSVVKSTPSGFLVALICGVQEGKNGHIAAKASAEAFEQYTHQSLVDLFSRADRASIDTSGCSVAAAIFNTNYNTVTWFGVGNVQGFLHHRSELAEPRYSWLVPHSGFVGDNQFSIRELTLPVRMGDVMIFATDSIMPEFADELPIEGKPRIIADTLLPQFARPEIDSLMLVTRYLGGI